MVNAFLHPLTPDFPSQFDAMTLLLLTAYQWIGFHPFELAGTFVFTYVFQRIWEKYDLFKILIINPIKWFKNWWWHQHTGTRFFVEQWDCQFSSSIPEYRTRHATKSYKKACNYAYRLAKQGREDRFVYVVDEHGRRLRTYQGIR